MNLLFEEPELQIIKFSAEDIITSSFFGDVGEMTPDTEPVNWGI